MRTWAFLTLYIAVASAQDPERCCDAQVGCFHNRPPYDHLPVPQCPSELKPAFELFTRSNQNQGQVVTRTTIPPNFDGSKRTAVLIHGWLGDRQVEWMRRMKEKILGRVDWNVITCGWSEGAQDLWYPQAAANTRSIGAEAALTVQNLVNNGGAARTSFWCLGHSLGSHVCGHAGKRHKWGRLTGLDPAGPLFDEYDLSVGLAPTDADLVDAIHTHGKGGLIMNLGTLRPLGQVDFYPNGGGVQPGCIINKKNQEKSDPDPVCSHYRAVYYVEESFQNAQCSFNARQRCTNERDIPNSCSPCGGVCQAIGLDLEQYTGRGLFYFTTNAEEPFCQG